MAWCLETILLFTSLKRRFSYNTGKIPLENLGWTPPLYELLLAILISFSGATGIGQMIFLVKALAAVVDWLLFMAVYLMASKFFGKKVGAVSAVLLLMCFPVFEANQFGGYTTVLGIAYILFMLLYLTKAIADFWLPRGYFHRGFCRCFVPSTCRFSRGYDAASDSGLYGDKVQGRLP